MSLLKLNGKIYGYECYKNLHSTMSLLKPCFPLFVVLDHINLHSTMSLLKLAMLESEITLST